MTTNPHFRIGALEAERDLDRAHIARLKAEITTLRAAILARLTIQERLPARATVEELWQAIEATNERLGDALYPNSKVPA